MERLEDDVRRVLTDRHHALPPNLVSLESIHVGARHRRRQRRLTAAGCVMAVALVAGSAALLGSGSAPGRSLDPATDPRQVQPTPTAAPADATPVIPVKSTVRKIDDVAVSVTSFEAGRGVVVLGSTGCGENCGPMAALAQSRDGGRTFTPMPVPDAMTAGYPEAEATGVRFRGASHGWLFGQGGLWSTHDGARTWGRVELPGAQPSEPGDLPTHIIAVEASGDRVWALTSALDSKHELWTSPVSTDEWRQVSILPTRGQHEGVHLTSADGRAYVIAPGVIHAHDADDAALLRSPCAANTPGRISAIGRVVWVACAVGDLWVAHVSDDHGRTFRAVPGDLDPVSALGARTAGEAFVMDPMRTLRAVRADGAPAGKPKRPFTDDAGGTYVGFATSSVGFAVPNVGGIWRTGDGGRTWAWLQVGRFGGGPP